MDALLDKLMHVIQTYLPGVVSVGSTHELSLWVATVVIVLVADVFFAMLTLKKLVKNLVLGYLVIYAGQYFFHMDLVPNWMLWALMAFFGPIVPVLNFIYQYLMK